jgi:hypothetical protein
VLAQGVARAVPAISFGMATNLIGGLVVLGALLLGIRPALGTLMNMLLVGFFSDLILTLRLVPDYTVAGWTPTELGARLGLVTAGTVIVGLATAIYIKGGLGAGPRDSLMLGLYHRLGWSIARVRTVIEVLVLVGGIGLGGTAGLGTLIWALTIGLAVQTGFRLLRVRPPAVGGLVRPAVKPPGQ